MAWKKLNHTFNNLPVLEFWQEKEKKAYLQFLNDGFKLIIMFCKPSKDKDTSVVVMGWSTEL